MKKLVVSLFMVLWSCPEASGAGRRGDIVFPVSGAANVVYSHDVHASKNGPECRDCCYRIYTAVEGHQQKTMADMKNGQSCGACYNGTRAFAMKTGFTRCRQ